MEMTNSQKCTIGETVVALELIERGWDVININNTYRNYKNADLICMNPNNGKSCMIQVKTGTTHNILTGFTSELDGTIPNIDTSIIGPWVFVYMPDDKLSNMEFFVLTKEEVKELITTSNKWYVTEWNRQLKSKPMVGIEVNWLKGCNQPGKSTQSFVYPEYKNTLGHDSINKWHKIDALMQ